MLLTEEQAREKWCPQKRMPYTYGMNGTTSANCDGEDSPAGVCVASGCMMWRVSLGVYCPQCNERYVGRDDLGKECNSCRDAKLEMRGYCGLAGKP